VTRLKFIAIFFCRDLLALPRMIYNRGFQGVLFFWRMSHAFHTAVIDTQTPRVSMRARKLSCLRFLSFEIR
jgi:hypothetical protein